MEWTHIHADEKFREPLRSDNIQNIELGRELEQGIIISPSDLLLLGILSAHPPAATAKDPIARVVDQCFQAVEAEVFIVTETQDFLGANCCREQIESLILRHLSNYLLYVLSRRGGIRRLHES